MGPIVWLLVVLLALPCGGAIDLCACSADDHGSSCGMSQPEAAGCCSRPEPVAPSCCASEAPPSEQEHRCPGCPTIELPQLPTTVAPSWSDDAPPPPLGACARAQLLPEPQAARRPLRGGAAWPPPDPVPLYLSLSVFRL